jgi:acetylornithine deacetylase/succinyl-diaminopimelate desuccinylase-like protein
MFRRELGAYTVSFGFSLPDEHFHAPDEFMRLASFERGQRAVCMLLERLAGL